MTSTDAEFLVRPTGSRPLVQVAARALAFVATAMACAFLWQALLDPAEMVRIGESGQTLESELVKEFGADALYSLIAAVGGFVLGFVIELRRRGDVIIRVVSVAAFSCLAAAIMGIVGFLIGPDAPETVLGGLAEGGTAPYRLVVHSWAAYLVWPIASLAGMLLLLLFRPEKSDSPRFVTSEGDNNDRVR
jgi:hypothetical protein